MSTTTPTFVDIDTSVKTDTPTCGKLLDSMSGFRASVGTWSRRSLQTLNSKDLGLNR